MNCNQVSWVISYEGLSHIDRLVFLQSLVNIIVSRERTVPFFYNLSKELSRQHYHLLLPATARPRNTARAGDWWYIVRLT
jgi:hypothetical protein